MRRQRRGRRRAGAGRRIALTMAALALVGAGVTAAAVSTGFLVIDAGDPSPSAAPVALVAAPGAPRAAAAEATVGASGGEVVPGPGSAGDTRAIPGSIPPAAALLPPVDSVGASAGGRPGAASPAATAAELAALDARLAIPVAGVRADQLADGFDQRRGADDAPRRHDALDIMAPRGTPVLAADDGRVLRLFDSADGGLMVYAADATGRFILLYGHLDAYAPELREGAPIRRGQRLGTVGTTGNAAGNAPHLHFAILRSDDLSRWWEGTPVNPYPLLR